LTGTHSINHTTHRYRHLTQVKRQMVAQALQCQKLQ
jgi:hypothetical protein